MANTRKDRLEAQQLVMVSIPNKVSKRMRSKTKKDHRTTDQWELLRLFHPKRWFDLMQRIKGR